MNFLSYLKKLSPAIDLALLIPLSVAAPVFKIFARIGGRNLPKCREFLKAAGVILSEITTTSHYSRIQGLKSLSEARFLLNRLED